jgi:hypothetical protein
LVEVECIDRLVGFYHRDFISFLEGDKFTANAKFKSWSLSKLYGVAV